MPTAPDGTPRPWGAAAPSPSPSHAPASPPPPSRSATAPPARPPGPGSPAPPPGDTASVEVAGATGRATVPEGADTAAEETDAYTPVLAAAPEASARACGTLADGTGGCAAGR
ncbi:hypothetical protein [Streptomyces sp. NPDC088915]|uniref:hypothetical protein n=1 Tax=Streptomyces sp. NPDC088915 TaxID=3365912 RepID=UPI0037F378A6